MYPGSCPGQAPGATPDMILSLSGSIAGGQAFITLKPWDYYRERMWTLWVAGKWIGYNFYMGPTGDKSLAVPFEPGTSIGSILACEVGQWDTFDATSIPSAEAEFQEQANAKRLLIQWKCAYSQTTITGDAQLSSVVVTGARRGRNVEAVEFFQQRGRLTYAIFGGTPNVNDRLIRWYAGDKLVAEGYRNGDGAVTCSAKNGSGLSIACTITYTGDVKAGVPVLDLKWPASYQIHYSTGALTYPRTPEATMQDNGNDEYFYSPLTDLSGGSYNYNVLQVDDEGDVQTAISVPSDSPQTVNAPPLAPTITSVVGVKNLAIYSEQFDNATWTKTDVVIAANAIAEPLYGAVTGDKMTEDGINTAHCIQSSNIAITANTNYDVSVYVKANGRTKLILEWAAASGVVRSYFDLTAVTNYQNSVSGSGVLNNAVITAIPGGWYRISQAAKCDNVSVNAKLGIYLLSAAGAEFYLGDTVSGVYLGGAQVEIGTAANAYVVSVATPALGASVTWTIGESGCTFKLYSSPFNEPVNYGSRASPPVVGPTLVDMTSAAAAVTVPSSIDLTAAYATLTASFDAAVSTANTAFSAGETGFLTALATLETSLNAAIDVWAAAVGNVLRDEKTLVSQQIALVQAAELAVATKALATATWKDVIGFSYGELLLFCGALLEGKSGRYTLPGGIAPGTAAGTGTVTGTAPDGFSATGQTIINSLKKIGQPFTRKSYMRFVVRATKGGIEERNDVEYLFEIDSTGASIANRPNAATIKSLSFSGGSVTAVIGVTEENARVPATNVDLYVVTKDAAVTITAPSVSGTLPASTGDYHEISVSFAMPGNGWYDFVALARATDGTRSELITRYPREYNTGVPVGVSTISAKVLGGRGIRPEES